jgi:hypothetical protein
MLVGAVGAVGAVAVAKGHPSAAEVLLEARPFLGGRLAVFLAGSAGAAADQVGLGVADDLLGIDSDIPLGGVEVQVAQELGGDVDGQPAVDASVANSRRKSWGTRRSGRPSTSRSPARATARVMASRAPWWPMTIEVPLGLRWNR